MAASGALQNTLECLQFEVIVKCIEDGNHKTLQAPILAAAKSCKDGTVSLEFSGHCSMLFHKLLDSMLYRPRQVESHKQVLCYLLAGLKCYFHPAMLPNPTHQLEVILCLRNCLRLRQKAAPARLLDQIAAVYHVKSDLFDWSYQCPECKSRSTNPLWFEQHQQDTGHGALICQTAGCGKVVGSKRLARQHKKQSGHSVMSGQPRHEEMIINGPDDASIQRMFASKIATQPSVAAKEQQVTEAAKKASVSVAKAKPATQPSTSEENQTKNKNQNQAEPNQPSAKKQLEAKEADLHRKLADLDQKLKALTELEERRSQVEATQQTQRREKEQQLEAKEAELNKKMEELNQKMKAFSALEGGKKATSRKLSFKESLLQAKEADLQKKMGELEEKMRSYVEMEGRRVKEVMARDQEAEKKMKEIDQRIQQAQSLLETVRSRDETFEQKEQAREKEMARLVAFAAELRAREQELAKQESHMQQLVEKLETAQQSNTDTSEEKTSKRLVHFKSFKSPAPCRKQTPSAKTSPPVLTQSNNNRKDSIKQSEKFPPVSSGVLKENSEETPSTPQMAKPVANKENKFVVPSTPTSRAGGPTPSKDGGAKQRSSSRRKQSRSAVRSGKGNTENAQQAAAAAKPKVERLKKTFERPSPFGNKYNGVYSNT
eukprot:g36686.t1